MLWTSLVIFNFTQVFQIKLILIEIHQVVLIISKLWIECVKYSSLINIRLAILGHRSLILPNC